MHTLFALFLFTIPPDSMDFEKPIVRGLEHIYRLNFDKADACFDSLIVFYPKHPAGYYFKATSLFYQIISCANPAATEDMFMEMNNRTIDLADHYPDPLVQKLFKGTAYGNIARYHVVNGDFLRAFYYARKAKSEHEDLVKEHPDFYDAYLTLGVYNYYASALPQWMGLVAGLLGLGGDREKGIEQLETAFRKGRVSRIEAHLLLANVYYEEGNYEKSLEYYNQLITLYPGNPFFRNQKGTLLFSMERFPESETVFLESHEMVNKRTPASQIFAAYYLGRISKLENDYNDAVRYFNEAVEISTRQRLFKSINAWLPATAHYQCGESYELAGNRSEAEKQYRLAKNHELGTSSIRDAAGNRLKYRLSDFEKELMRARHLILYGNDSEGLAKLDSLRPVATGDYGRFMGQIGYYTARVAFKRGKYENALKDFRLAVDEKVADEEWRSASAFFYSGQCHLHLNQIKEAEKSFKQVLEFDANSVSPRLTFQSRQYLKTLSSKK